MKQILGLGTGTATFTPGGAGAGTLVIAGMVGFSPARLLAVTNVTQKKLIYAAEITGKSGTWTAVTAAGGTLTLDFNTTGYSSTDVLRCFYETDEAPATVRPRGGNLWPVDLDTCTLADGNTRTADYGPGPRPGTRATRLVLAGDNAGANTGTLVLAGRTDGAMFGMAVELKGTGAIELRIRATGSSSSVTETVASMVVSPSSTWKRFVLRGYVAQWDCSTLQAEIRASGAGGTVDAFGVDLRLLENATDFPEYQPPSGEAQTIYITKRVSVSIAAWGDSMVGGSGGGEWRTGLSRMLKGAPIYNGGVGGETSTQVKDRFIATTDAAKTYRSYGITVIECGTNNASDPPTVVADVATMVAAMPHGRFLILPVHNGPANDHTTGNYTNVNTIYRKLKSRYGSRFVDTLMPLRSGGDTVQACYMYDTTHFNAAGNGVVALEIYRAIVRNGWIDGAPASDVPLTQDDSHAIVVGASVVAAVSTANVLLEQGRRHGFIIRNDTATGILYIGYGWYASASSPIKVAPGETFKSIGEGYHGQVTGYWTVADGYARVLEII